MTVFEEVKGITSSCSKMWVRGEGGEPGVGIGGAGEGDIEILVGGKIRESRLPNRGYQNRIFERTGGRTKV
jgi:hypothetical protein